MLSNPISLLPPKNTIEFVIHVCLHLLSDLNECTDGHDCHMNATCMNSHGSYVCICNHGYTGNGITCNNINECLLNPCDDKAKCTDFDGGHSCSCNHGFTGNGTHCKDINECQSKVAPCHKNSTCVNTVGSYSCSCLDGHTGNGTHCYGEILFYVFVEF